jgi:acyl homoserine lactone synthase
MFALRAKIFAEKLGWEVKTADGRERDRYDDFNPLYLLYTDPCREEVIGSLRLMPTTGPTLLHDVFGETIPAGAYFASPNIWECTRFCVDEDRVSSEEATRISGLLMLAICELGLKSGIEMVVANFDPVMIRMYRRIGCEVDVLGRTDAIGRRPVCLGAFAISPEALRSGRARLGVSGSVIASRLPLALERAA